MTELVGRRKGSDHNLKRVYSRARYGILCGRDFVLLSFATALRNL